MRLTTFTDYSLRVLMYLSLKGDELATITEIAECYSISRSHLMKVVYELGRLGYIETIRGKHGGMRLHHAPGDINLGAVVRNMENDFALTECFGDDNQCRLTPACVLRGVVSEALESFLTVMDQYSLADLIAPQRKLSKLLALG